MACPILERTSSFEFLCERTAPRYLKLVTLPSFCPFTFKYLVRLGEGAGQGGEAGRKKFSDSNENVHLIKMTRSLPKKLGVWRELLFMIYAASFT